MKISVITVCFNAEATLEAAIRSLLAQTCRDFEFIVIDGGSTDATREILERYRDQITTLVSEPDDGIYFAMNKGLELARGSIVYFLNADDALHDEGVFADVLAAFRRFPQADLIYGDALACYPDGTSTLSRHPNILSWEHFATRTICHQALFAKRTAFGKVGLFDSSYRLAADFAWILKSIWQCDLNYQYFPRTVCRFSMAGSHAAAGNREPLGRERAEAIGRYVAGRYDFLGSYQRELCTARALLFPEAPFAVELRWGGTLDWRAVVKGMVGNIHERNRLRLHALRICLHRLRRLLGRNK